MARRVAVHLWGPQRVETTHLQGAPHNRAVGLVADALCNLVHAEVEKGAAGLIEGWG